MLSSLVDAAVPAYVGAAADTQALTGRLLGVSRHLPADMARHVETIAAEANGLSPEQVWAQVAAGGPGARSQATLHAAMQAGRRARKLATMPGKEVDRLHATGAAHAGDWLHALPNKSMGAQMSSQAFTQATCLWPGLAPGVLKASGDKLARRHHAVRDAIFDLAAAAGLRPHREATVGDSQGRPADVLIP